MPTDKTALREAWEREHEKAPDDEGAFYCDGATLFEADDLARRAYDAGVVDCIAALDSVDWVWDDLPAVIRRRLAALKGRK